MKFSRKWEEGLVSETQNSTVDKTWQKTIQDFSNANKNKLIPFMIEENLTNTYHQIPKKGEKKEQFKITNNKQNVLCSKCKQ